MSKGQGNVPCIQNGTHAASNMIETVSTRREGSKLLTEHAKWCTNDPYECRSCADTEHTCMALHNMQIQLEEIVSICFIRSARSTRVVRRPAGQSRDPGRHAERVQISA